MLSLRYSAIIGVCTCLGGCADFFMPDPQRDAGLLADAGLSSDAGFVPDRDSLDAGTTDPDDPPIESSFHVDPTCIEDGCIRAFTFLGTFPRARLRHFVFPEVVLDNGYHVWRVTYWTHDREAIATITAPDLTLAPSQGWHVVVNHPGTVGLADACAWSNSDAAAGVAGYFGARGFIGVAVDYPGLGTAGLHPYLVGDSEGRAGLDAARATLTLMKAASIEVSGRVALAGVSQGGHAALAALRLAPTYAPDLDVKAAAVAAPAGVFVEQWAESLAWSQQYQIPLVYHALALYAWEHTYSIDVNSPNINSLQAISSIWRPEIKDAVDLWLNTLCIVGNPDATDGAAGVVGPSLYDVIPSDPAVLWTDDFVASYLRQDFSAYPAIQHGFDDNRVRPFLQTAPLLLYQGDSDDTVLLAHTNAVVDALRAGGMDVDYRVVAGGHHTDVAFFVLAIPQIRTEEVLSWLREQLDR